MVAMRERRRSGSQIRATMPYGPGYSGREKEGEEEGGEEDEDVREGSRAHWAMTTARRPMMRSADS